MADRALRDLLRYVYRMVGPPAGILSDSELLGRFVDCRDEAAFEALVWRHGSMVLSVCRRILRQEQDAEDAFQAAFLALARKAGSVRRRGAIGSWLYRVALRVALRAKEQAAATKSLGPVPEARTAPVQPHEVEQRELRLILEQEIRRLPSKYRAVVVLRYLEGRSTAEAATALNCPQGTVLSRLSWARRRLQVRLAARGAALPAAMAAVGATGEAMGAPPFLWVASAVRDAVAFASSGTSGLGPTRSALLAEGVLRAMMMTKVKVAAVLILGTLTSGAILQAQFLKAGKPETQPERASAAPAIAAQPNTNAEPPEVSVAHPVKREIVEYVDFTGQTEASVSIEIRAHISATLNKVIVQPGAEVKRGDLLFELDSRALQAKEMKAAAQIRGAEAAIVEANQKLENARDLEKKRYATPAAVDSAAFAVSESKIALSVAQSEWEQAKIDLSAAKITAPVAGRVGRMLQSEGSLVGPTTPLTTVFSDDPIRVVFQMDERTFMSLRKKLQGLGAGPKITVLLGLVGDEGFPRRGSLESVDNRFNPGTGTIRTSAVFPNSNQEILAGMFARVRLLAGDPHQALLVPDGTVWSDNGLKYVRIVNDKNAIEHRYVTLGQVENGLRVIQQGLTAADRVIVKSAGPLKVGELVKPSEVPATTTDAKAKEAPALPGSKK
jgi:RND family efflux transporter MFP subunit